MLAAAPTHPGRVPLGFHWAQYAHRQVRPHGGSFLWVNADTLADPAYATDTADLLASQLSFVLEIKFTSERRLLDRAAWQQDLVNVYLWLEERQLLARVLGLQLDDELYSRFATGVGAWHPVAWPQVSALPPRYDAAGNPTWHHYLPDLYREVGARLLDLRRCWFRWPRLGVGLAETGGIDAPTLPGQDWWGLNFYTGAGPRRTPAAIQALYTAAAAKGLPLMPVLGVYTDSTFPLPPLSQMGEAYLPVLAQHRAQLCAIGVFCLYHPSQWPHAHPAHLQGRGILHLPPEYAEGVRWVAGMYGEPELPWTVPEGW